MFFGAPRLCPLVHALLCKPAKFSGDSYWQRQCRCKIGSRGQCKESTINDQPPLISWMLPSRLKNSTTKFQIFFWSKNGSVPLDQNSRWTGWKQGIQATSMTRNMRLSTISQYHYLLVPNVRRRPMMRNPFHRASLRELRWILSFVIRSIVFSLAHLSLASLWTKI